MTAAQRKVTAFRLDDDLLEGLQLLYERDGILPSEQVRRAVRAWLEAKGIMAPLTRQVHRGATAKGAKPKSSK